MGSKKIWLSATIIILIAAGAIYLNRSYAYFYDYFGKYNLKAPTMEKTFYAPSDQNIQYSYVALGDSLTAGVGATTSSESFPNLLFSESPKLRGFIMFSG